MKCVIVLLALVVVAIAQRPGGNEGEIRLVDDEVKAILAANSGISIDDCAAKCDAVFALIDANDENRVDRECRTICEREIRNLQG